MWHVANGHGDTGIFLILFLGRGVDFVAEPVPGGDTVALWEVFATVAPPDAFTAALVDEDLVGEDGATFEVLDVRLGVAQRFHEHLVGEVAHALSDAEHARLDVVDIKSAVALLGSAADDIVAEREDRVACFGDGAFRDSGGDIGLSAHAGEGGTEVDAAVAVVDAEQGHMLDELDADVLIGLGFSLGILQRLNADEPQTEYLFGAECVAAVIAVDRTAIELLGEVSDPPIFLVERPEAVGDAREARLFFEDAPAVVEVAHSVEVADDVGAVSQLHAGGGELAVGGVGDKRHHVHDASLHNPVKELVEFAVHLLGIHPEVQRARVDRVLGANDGALLDAGDVVLIAPGVEGTLAVDVLVQTRVGT